MLRPEWVWVWDQLRPHTRQAESIHGSGTHRPPRLSGLCGQAREVSTAAEHMGKEPLGQHPTPACPSHDPLKSVSSPSPSPTLQVAQEGAESTWNCPAHLKAPHSPPHPTDSSAR